MPDKSVSKIIFFFSFIVCYIFSFGNIIAQYSNDIETDLTQSKMKDRAEHAAKTGDVYSALFYYEAVAKKDSTDLDAVYQLAEMNRVARNYKKAELIYSNIFLKAPAKYPFALYYKALMQKMNGKYEEAKKNMLLFQKKGGKSGDRNFLTLLGKEIAGCDSGIVFTEFPDNIKVENIGNSVNHPHTEFSPFLLDSTTMIFGSLRMDSVMFFDAHDEQYEKPPVRQIYKAEKTNNAWEEKGKYEVFNDPDVDMGNFVYSPFSGKYFFSKCSKDEVGRVTCKIYSIEKVNGQWAAPELLPHPINMEGHTSTQPAIMLDTVAPVAAPVKKGQTNTVQKNTKKTNTPVKPAPKPSVVEYLYFVSDRPNGRGGMDIWYTSYNATKKTWAPPANLLAVNTPATECTPFFHIPSQTLYFSSNGNATAGGLDIFKIKRDGKKYLKPQNMAFPINSSQDELGFMLSDDGKKGFLVSNRPGGTPYFHETCCDDIYAFEIMPEKPFICNLSLSLVDPDTNGCIPNQMMSIISYDMINKKTATEKINVVNCKYEMPLAKEWIYKFSIDREGYEKDTLFFETRDMCVAEIIEKKLVMNKTKKEVVVNDIPEEGKTFVLKDIQYDINEASLTADAMKALDSIVVPFLKEYPNDRLMISAHTDDQGSHKYNHNLSQRRAENVVIYLVSKGISASRLHARGFGETKPLMPNQNPDGTDNSIARGLNRRTEFLLLKENEKPVK